MSVIERPAQELWLPGRGVMPVHVRQAVQAIREYGPDLSLARHDASGDWVVTKNGQPVFGLGVELPAPERIKQMLYEADTQRHGGKLAEKIQKLADARQKAVRDEANDLTGVAAEALEWAAHKEHRTSYKRIYIPEGVRT